MMLLVAVGISVSAVLGFYIGNQMGQTQHVRDHLEQTRSQRQTMNSQQVG